jgi:hypothetical protein
MEMDMESYVNGLSYLINNAFCANIWLHGKIFLVGKIFMAYEYQ